MNKKLIAAAVVAGLAAPMAAQADVSVYGRAQVAITNFDDGGAITGTAVEDEFGQSRVGVRWSEDLGGGMTAKGEMEFGPHMDDFKKGSPGSRQAWLGLKGGFGEIQLGTVLQPYKYSGGVKYDAFVATAAQARGTGGMLGSAFGQSGYFANAIQYKNKIGAAKIALAYSPEKNTAIGTPNNAGAKGDLMASVVVGFAGGEAGVAYAKDNNDGAATTGNAGQKNTKIFGKYTFAGNSTVLAQYENHKSAEPASTTTKVLFLGYQLKMGGGNKLAVQLGQTKPDGKTKTNYAAAGFFHNFSKKTKVYVAYRTTKKDADTGAPASKIDEKALTVGLQENF